MVNWNLIHLSVNAGQLPFPPIKLNVELPQITAVLGFSCYLMLVLIQYIKAFTSSSLHIWLWGISPDYSATLHLCWGCVYPQCPGFVVHLHLVVLGRTKVLWSTSESDCAFTPPQTNRTFWANKLWFKVDHAGLVWMHPKSHISGSLSAGSNAELSSLSFFGCGIVWRKTPGWSLQYSSLWIELNAELNLEKPRLEFEGPVPFVKLGMWGFV